MRCPYCQSLKTFVSDSRANEAGVIRRRECKTCRQRFSTQEVISRYDESRIVVNEFDEQFTDWLESKVVKDGVQDT